MGPKSVKNERARAFTINIDYSKVQWAGLVFVFLGIVIVVWTSLPGVLVNIVFAAVILRMMPPSMSRIWVASAPHLILGSLFSFRQFAHDAFAVVLIPTPFFGLTTVSMVTAVVGGSVLIR